MAQDEECHDEKPEGDEDFRGVYKAMGVDKEIIIQVGCKESPEKAPKKISIDELVRSGFKDTKLIFHNGSKIYARNNERILYCPKTGEIRHYDIKQEMIEKPIEEKS